MRPQTPASIFICLLDHAYEACIRGTISNMKMVGQKCLNIGEVCNKTVKLELWSTLIDCYCQESKISKTTWLRYLFLYLIKIWLHILWRHHLANLHSLKTWISLEWKKRYLKIVYSIFLLIQTTCTCLCFKMAPLGKMQFSW